MPRLQFKEIRYLVGQNNIQFCRLFFKEGAIVLVSVYSIKKPEVYRD